MPSYEVELSDGRKFQVEADSQPNEADILAKLDETSYKGTQPLVSEMGMRSPGGYEMSDHDSSPLAANSSMMQMFGRMAHPSTTGEMLQFALPSGIGVGAMDAARSSVPAAAMDAGKAVAGGLRKIPILGKMMDTVPEMWNGYKESRALRGTLRANPFPPLAEMDAAKPVAAAAESSSVLSASARADLAKRGFTPELIAQMEQRGSVSPTVTAPAAGPRPPTSLSLVDKIMGPPQPELPLSPSAILPMSATAPTGDEAASMLRAAIERGRAMKKGQQIAHQNIDLTGRGGR